MKNREQKGFIFLPFLIILGFFAIAIIKLSSNSSSLEALFSIKPASSAPASPSVNPSPTISAKPTTKPVIKTPTPRPSPSTGGNLSPTLAPTNPAYYTNPPTSAPTSTPGPSITTPTLRVSSPNGGESLKVGNTATITWEATGIFSTFSIMYSSCASCASTIANVNGMERSYNWVVSVGNLQEPQQFKIKIISFPTNYSPNPVDSSDDWFTVSP